MNVVEKITQENALPAPMTALTPMAMLAQAIERGMSPDMIGKLMDHAERWEANNNRKAFDEAMAAAKSEIPLIIKNRQVDFTSQKGRTNYKYEDLGEIARTVAPILAKHGLSYRFRVSSAVNEPVHVTCVITHKSGHYDDSNTLHAGRDESGNKNAIQAIGSTITYLQRMTLKAALGLAVSNDDDGRTSEPADTVTQGQADTIRELLDEVGGNRAVFLKYFKVDAVEQIPASQYDRVIQSLNAKRTQQ